MGPDRIRAWLNRVPAGSHRIQLVFEQIGVSNLVAQWTRDELQHADAAHLILDAAQEHCNDLATAARYTLQWVGEDNRPLSSKVIRMQPDDAEPQLGAGQVEDATLAGALGQLLRHQEVMARLYVGAQTGILSNLQQVLQMTREHNAELHALNKELTRRVRNAEARAEGEAMEAETAESLAKAAAVEKFTTVMTEQVLPLVVMRMTNGHGGAS